MILTPADRERVLEAITEAVLYWLPSTMAVADKLRLANDVRADAARRLNPNDEEPMPAP